MGLWRARRGPGKAYCAKKSGERRLAYQWSRNLAHEMVATADEESALTWGPASGSVRVEVGAGNHWRPGRWEEGGK